MNLIDKMKGNISAKILTMLQTHTWSSQSTSSGTIKNRAELIAAVRILADNLSTMPINFFAEIDGNKTKMKDDERYYILNRSPNPSMNAQTWRSKMVTSSILDGNGFSLIKKVNGKTRLIYTPDIDNKNYTISENGELFYHLLKEDGEFKNVKDDGKYDKIPSNDVVHIKFVSISDKNGIMGDGALDILDKILSTSEAGYETLRNFYNDGARPGMLLKNTVPLTAKELKNYEKAVEEFEKKMSTLSNQQKMSLLPGNTEMVKWETNIEEAKILETLAANKALISSLLGIPVFMLGDYDQSKFNSITTLTQTFVTLTIRPWAAIWRRELEDKLLLDSEWAENMSIEMNVNSLIEADFATKWSSYKDAIATNVISPQQVQRWEGYPILDPKETSLISAQNMDFELYKESKQLANEKLRLEIDAIKNKPA